MQTSNDTPNKETTPSSSSSNLVPLYPVMAYQFTPPTTASGNSSAFIPVNTNPDVVQYSIQAQEKTPLLESQQQPKGGITYQINHHYHPKQAVKYAKQRPVCCCLTLLCMCCCLLFVVGGIVGAIFGIYALECVNLTAVQTTSFNTTMSSNITGISISSDIGDISVKYDGTIGDSIIISITKYASKDSDADLFDDTFDVIDGQVYFSENANKPAGLKAVFGCLRSDIEVSLPFNVPQNLALNIKSESGNIAFTGLNPTMNTWTSANLQTTNGNIDINNDLVGNVVSLITTNGNIAVANIFTGDLTMTTVNGNVQADVSLNSTYIGEQNACSLHASSVNGNLDVDPSFSCLSSKVSMDTVNGNIDSSVVGYSGNFDFEATNGKVTITAQLPVSVTYTSNSNSDKEGAISGYNSTGSFSLTTVNGNVKSEFD